eukprot:1161024-Pelagomonas_calceolata.AAC.8
MHQLSLRCCVMVLTQRCWRAGEQLGPLSKLSDLGYGDELRGQKLIGGTKSLMCHVMMMIVQCKEALAMWTITTASRKRHVRASKKKADAVSDRIYLKFPHG